jgi:peptidoglycan/xylan/chitin deacetylase (PgdA/CDA1 family)
MKDNITCKGFSSVLIINSGILWPALVLVMTLNVFGQDSKKVTARITTWYQNKPGAVSVSFDDASYSQHTAAYPILEKLGIKATFSIVGEWVGEAPAFSAEPGSMEIKKMGWPQLLELYDQGHELAAHGYTHEKYDKLMPVPNLVEEMNKIKTLIESRIQTKVYTMNYPYSYASGNIPIAAEEAGYLFGRTGLDTVNPSSPGNMYLLATHVILNETSPDSVIFQNWLDQAKGNWLILMYHHLFEEGSKEMEIIRSHDVVNSYSLSPFQFEKQMKSLVSVNYWVAPVSTIGKYITERDNTEIRVIRTKKKIYINTFTNLNKNVYNHPLTIEVELPWKKVSVQGSLNDGIFTTEERKLYIDAYPEKQIVITKESY